MSDRENLFTYEDWHITGYLDTPEFFDEVTHSCPWKDNWFKQDKVVNLYVLTHGCFCPNCGTEIPDELMAVWKLKNFDLLQVHAQQEQAWQALKGASFYLHGTTKANTVNSKPGSITAVVKP